MEGSGLTQVGGRSTRRKVDYHGRAGEALGDKKRTEWSGRWVVRLDEDDRPVANLRSWPQLAARVHQGRILDVDWSLVSISARRGHRILSLKAVARSHASLKPRCPVLAGLLNWQDWLGTARASGRLLGWRLDTWRLRPRLMSW